MSGAQKYIERDLDCNDTQIEILVGILDLYSLVGSAAAGRTSDWIGRRYTIVLAGAIFFVGAILMGFATNYAFLMVGRFVAGIGVGYALMIAPVYTAEVSPASARGFLTSFPEVFINVGILLGYVSNYTFSKLPLHLGCFEESKLRLAGIKEAAGIPKDFNDDVVQVSKRSHGEGIWKELLIHPTPIVRHILLAAVGIHFFQQASGIDAVVLYSVRIFEKAGIVKDTPQLLATIAVGFVKTMFILVATFFLDKIGRRPLLLASIGGMIASLTTLGFALTIIDHSDHKITWAIALCFIGILSYVAFFSIGMGPITWVYSSEIFPLRLRAQGCSMGVAMNRVVSGIIGMTFISLYKAISIGGAFFVFTGFAAIGFIFFYTLYPETRGKNLEEVEKVFGTFFRWISRQAELDRQKEAAAAEK
ncbi:putative major facilitator, sugar transporter, major facilitator superfamily [Helianthus anomalus]